MNHKILCFHDRVNRVWFYIQYPVADSWTVKP